MMLRSCFVLMMVVVIYTPAKAQLFYKQLFSEYRVTIGHNLRLPGNGKQRTIAIVSRDKKREYNKFMVGGFTAGISAFSNINSSLDLKWTANVSRQIFWREPALFNNGPNVTNILGYTYPVVAEYYLGLNGVAHYRAGEKFSVGAGVGFDILLASHTSFPYALSTTDEPVSYRNREFKPIMPVVPVELSWKEARFLYNIRYEVGLASRYRTALQSFGQNMFHTLSFEIGMKIGSDSD
jgi:hypothetical protein